MKRIETAFGTFRLITGQIASRKFVEVRVIDAGLFSTWSRVANLRHVQNWSSGDWSWKVTDNSGITLHEGQPSAITAFRQFAAYPTPTV